ncbi:DUF6082 family protein [Nonomuraea jabiensis]|uniref:Uncharacterized protein n=1 Tax=Nonomuraea jabiensis TaxID=882448 RepID=A0A7W9G390_9ACTN|nr:DUF6082 family protein [Nonomuraea jabiensis]MBB5776408.1 hypothetical protein [Nonomuraea jabiensis]
MLLLLVIALLCATATLLSPLLLDLLVPAGSRWQQLSDIGQTYGAASAVLSAFALVAIGVSLFLQAREMRISREEAQRTHHLQLMQLQIENPALHRVLGMPHTGLDPRVHLYLNLLLSYWEMLFIVGELPESILVDYARTDFFGTEAGTRFWKGTREYRRLVARNRRSQRFVAAIDLAWRQSLEARPAETPVRGSSPRPPAVGAAAVVAAVGAAVAWLIWGKKRRDTG